MSTTKVITLSKYELNQIEKPDKSLSNKFISMRNVKEKSLSKSKNLKSSMTLRHNKNHSPIKERHPKNKHGRDLKESGDLRRDFIKKKSPEIPRPLDLLKKSGSLHEFTGKNMKESGHMLSSPNTVHMKKKR